ncbi:hypothetical protein B0T22DRAFT_439202 [Podospora appendiculata]|uniref:Uncharacterized protein n=1 Tax=Podospora appendiculata TaxID=314037 RepID=A0AAE0X7N8_9PEZI|nr:hypothetical protein B0T22DRAFT_439202 [Podospora appendiculata]
MHFVFAAQVLLAPFAVALAAAGKKCTAKPTSCAPDSVINILSSPDLITAASSFCSAYNQPTTTAGVTATETPTVGFTETEAAPTTTTTFLQTVTVVTTQYSTTYTPFALKARRDVDLGVFSALSRFSASRISSACSCVVATPSPALTETKTVATETATLPPSNTVVVTVTETRTESQTTVVQTVIPTHVAAVCASASFCCAVVAPWYTNGDYWGPMCNYYPSSPSELVAERCYLPGVLTSYQSAPGSRGCAPGTTAACCLTLLPVSEWHSVHLQCWIV